jgi:hypothetical protein
MAPHPCKRVDATPPPQYAAGSHEKGRKHPVLAQVGFNAKTNEHKAALELLGILPVKGKILTGDALFCQRDRARPPRERV